MTAEAAIRAKVQAEKRRLRRLVKAGRMSERAYRRQLREMGIAV